MNEKILALLDEVEKKYPEKALTVKETFKGEIEWLKEGRGTRDSYELLEWLEEILEEED